MAAQNDLRRRLAGTIMIRRRSTPPAPPVETAAAPPVATPIVPEGLAPTTAEALSVLVEACRRAQRGRLLQPPPPPVVLEPLGRAPKKRRARARLRLVVDKKHST